MENSNNKLEVMCNIIVVEGRFGPYHKYPTFVEELKTGKIYKSKNQVIEERDNEINSLNKEVMILAEKLTSLIKNRDTIKSKYWEIERVFDMEGCDDNE